MSRASAIGKKVLLLNPCFPLINTGVSTLACRRSSPLHCESIARNQQRLLLAISHYLKHVAIKGSHDLLHPNPAIPLHKDGKDYKTPLCLKEPWWVHPLSSKVFLPGGHPQSFHSFRVHQ